MAGLSRTKGKVGEREAVNLLRELTGMDVRRKVRQHDGDSDVEGLPGWCVEVKRDNGMSVDAMWKQACRQCSRDDLPLLVYRRDRQPWRCRYPPSVMWLGELGYDPEEDGALWVESDLATWWWTVEVTGQMERFSNEEVA